MLVVTCVLLSRRLCERRFIGCIRLPQGMRPLTASFPFQSDKSEKSCAAAGAGEEE